MARFETAVFYTFDNLSLSGGEYEEERDTRCMVSELKEAEACDDSSHSTLHSSVSSSSTKGKSSRLLLITHPSISLFTHHFLCALCKTLTTDANMQELGVCSLPKWSRNCMRNPMFTASWYYCDFHFVFPLFDSTLLVLKTTTCTIVPHTEYHFRNPVPCPPLLPHAG